MFDVLVYTDCSSDQSLNGQSGFEFAAASTGVTVVDQDFVRRRMQHVVPVSLEADNWDMHPGTCVYALDAQRAYLSRGRSTGQTLSGRPGNQLTETICTSDQNDILPGRPAQLCSSPMWSIERPATRMLRQWESPLEIDPGFEVGSLHDMVNGDVSARLLLPAFLTMVEQTQRTPRVKLVIKHPDQDLVMRWVAIASLFLDAEAALRLEFRVFADDPIRSGAHIVGAHPLLSPDLTIARAPAAGVNMLDLEQRECSTCEVSSSAQRHADWFLKTDPYSALDAVETSRRWGAFMALETAALAAGLACLTEPPSLEDEGAQAVAQALGKLAAAGALDELDSYGELLVERLASSAAIRPPAAAQLDEALWALSVLHQTELAERIALIGLTCASGNPSWARLWAASRAGITVATFHWTDESRQAKAASLLTEVLQGGADEDLPALFRLARELGTDMPAARVQGEIDSLAMLVVASPALGPEVGLWVHRDAVVQSLRLQLARGLQLGAPELLESLQGGGWDWLMAGASDGSAADALTPWLESRELAVAERTGRPEILLRCQQLLPDWAWPLCLRTVEDLDPCEVAQWIRTHRSVDPELGGELEALLLRGRRHTTLQPGAVRVLDALADPGVTGIPSGLVAVVGDYRRIVAVLEGMRRPVLDKQGGASVDGFVEVAARLPEGYEAMVADVVVDAPDPHVRQAIAKRCERFGAALLEDVLVQRLLWADVSALIGALRILAQGDKRAGVIARRALDEVWDDAATVRARGRMIEALPESWQVELDGYLRPAASARWVPGFFKQSKPARAYEQE